MKLVHDEQTDVLHVFPLFPSPGQHVPPLGGTDDDVTLEKMLQISVGENIDGMDSNTVQVLLLQRYKKYSLEFLFSYTKQNFDHTVWIDRECKDLQKKGKDNICLQLTFDSSLRSVAVSPVNSTTFLPSWRPNLLCQSA